MKKKQSHNSDWLDILEILLAIGSLGGSVASLVFQQVVFASLPLSLSVTLNLVRRKQLSNLVDQGNQTKIENLVQDNQTAITKLSQQSQEHQANIKTLSEQLTVWPSSIVELSQRNQEQQTNIKNLSEQLVEVQQLTTGLSTRTQELSDYIQSQEAKVKPIEEVKYLSQTENLNQVAATIPNSAESYYQRGLILQDSGHKQGAVEDYSKTIQLDPCYALAYHKRGLVKFTLGDKKGAIEDLRKATKLYFEQGSLADYQRVRDLSKEVHDLSSPARDKVPEKLILGGLFS